MLPSLRLCEAAALAYIDPNLFAGNVSARIMVDENVTTIAIAGSNDSKDWLEDFESVLVTREGRGKLFNGFADMGDECKDSFLKTIKSYPEPYELVAHSAGCPVACQIAAWMAEEGIKPQFVQLLAAPQAGDSEWAAYYRSKEIPTLRVAMVHDPVPSLPGAHRGGCYESDTLVLDNNGATYDCQDIDSEFNLIGIISQAAHSHGIGNYVRGVRCFLKAG